VTNASVTDASVVADFVSGYFTTDATTSNIKVWEQAATGYASDGTTMQFYGDQNSITDSNYVTLGSVLGDSGPVEKGWKIATNYVGQHSDTATSGNYGKRIVIQFTEKLRSGFLGGNKVPTNFTKYSGVVNETPSDTTNSSSYLATFPNTTYDYPLSSETLKISDAKAYYGGTYNFENVIRTVDGSELKFPARPDGTRDNDYVDIKLTLMSQPLPDVNGGYPGGVPTFTVVSVWLLTHGTTEGVETPITTDGKKVSVSTNDVTLYASGTAQFADGSTTNPPTITPTPATIYTLMPRVNVKDTKLNLGSSTTLAQNITGWDWWSPTQNSNLSSLPLASENVTGASGASSSASDVVVSRIQGGCATGDTSCPTGTVADNSASITPQTDTDYTVTGLNLKAATSGTLSTLAPSGGLLVTTDHSIATQDVINGSAQNDGTATLDPDNSFTMYVMLPTVSQLPLTGASETGRMFLLMAAAMLVIAGGVGAGLAINRRRTR
jgi:hypothetical protein